MNLLGCFDLCVGGGGGGELEELMALWISLCDTLRKRHVCIVISEEVEVSAACCGVLPRAPDCSLSVLAFLPLHSFQICFPEAELRV